MMTLWQASVIIKIINNKIIFKAILTKISTQKEGSSNSNNNFMQKGAEQENNFMIISNIIFLSMIQTKM